MRRLRYCRFRDHRLLEQLTVSSRLRAVEAAWRAVRQFATHLNPRRPGVHTHRWQPSRGVTSSPSDQTGARRPGWPPRHCGDRHDSQRLGKLRTFVVRINRIRRHRRPAPCHGCSPATCPRPTKPLSRSLDEPTAFKFMTALAVEQKQAAPPHPRADGPHLRVSANSADCATDAM